jgi:predicted nucleic acid-binding Zn ribbon protein
MIKKVFVSLCVLPLLLTACSNDEVIAPVADSGEAIGFGTILAPLNRGAVFTKDNLKEAGNGFSVVAYDQGNVITSWNDYKGSVPSAGGNLMNNQKVTWNEAAGAWSYSPRVNWPGIVPGDVYGHVTFFALGGLAKDDLTIGYNDAYLPTFDYETEPAAADQKDLVADVLFDEQWSANKTVTFQFEHILSRIGFQAKMAGDYTTDYNAEIVVKSLKVKYTDDRVKSEGLYTFNANSADASGKGSWSEGPAVFTDNAESGELMAADVDLTTTATRLNDITKYLMLIPQAVADGDLTVELDYEITYDKGGATEQVETVNDATYDIPAITYETGKAYTYTFNITLRPIVFSVGIDVTTDWELGSTGNDITLIP